MRDVEVQVMSDNANNYVKVKQIYDRETNPKLKHRYHEMLCCMEEAAKKRGIKPENWKPTEIGNKPDQSPSRKP